MSLSDFCLLFFFFKQKTAYEMRISDWSSDVCSSDLQALSRKILRVARDVFFADGFGRSTAERIAAKAGISKRTLYARYGSKKLLFEAVILREIDRKSVV